MNEMLNYYCDYNVWANQKMADYFRNKPEEKLTDFIENSYPSIRKTGLHLLGAQRSWLARMQQNAQNNMSTIDTFESTNEVFDALVENSKSFQEFVRNQNDHFFDCTMYFNSWDGTPWEMQPKLMIHHCMNHSTYHRGQLITMSRQLGWKKNLPSTDMLYFWRAETQGNSSNRV